MDLLERLASWIDANGTQVVFAAAVGISAAHLSNFLGGHRKISYEKASSIETVTKGAFTADALMRDQAARFAAKVAAE